MSTEGLTAWSDPFRGAFVGELLRAESRQIASRAAGVALSNGLRTRWGPDTRTAWAESFESRVHELAGALSAGRPQDFVSRIEWARVAYEARGVDPGDLAAGLRALRLAVVEVLPSEDAPAVAAVLDRAECAARAPASVPPGELVADGAHASLAAGYLVAILEGDRRRALSLVYEAVSSGRLSVPEAYEHVFLPVLRELGRMWHLAEVNVAEEHFATATTLMAMAQLGPLAARKAPCGRAILAATVAGNAHEVGVRMVADRFEWEGWRVVYLGPSVPPEDLAQGAVDFGVDVVALSATLIVQLDAMEKAIAAVRALAPDVRIIVGGAALGGDADLARRLGADALAGGPEEAVRLAHACTA